MTNEPSVLEEDDTIETATTGSSALQARSLTLLQEAQKRRLEREQSLFLDIPTWGGELVGEYRIVGSKELTLIGERAVRRTKQAKQNGSYVSPMQGEIDLIVEANVGLYMRDPESGDRVPIEDEYGHVGFDRIAHVLGVEGEVQGRSDVVKYLMSEREDDGSFKENVVAIGIHANSISTWMRDPSKRSVDVEDLLGES